MDMGAIDRSATRGDGPVRGASPTAKLIALALVLGTVLASWNVLVLAGAFLLLISTLVWGRVDLKLALSLAAYPAIFALVFAFASAPDAMTAAVIVAKAVTAALAAVSVILTTPYPQVFSRVQRIVPGIVGDSMLMTYRSMFILLDKFNGLLRATRLRAGIRSGQPLRSARATASALGGLLLYSIDLAQRDYDIMRVRGYEGRLRISAQRSTNRLADAAMLLGSLSLLCLSVAWRVGSAALNPYSWLVPLAALTVLAAAALSTRRTTP